MDLKVLGTSIDFSLPNLIVLRPVLDVKKGVLAGAFQFGGAETRCHAGRSLLCGDISARLPCHTSLVTPPGVTYAVAA
jgi:hypothetical protein